MIEDVNATITGIMLIADNMTEDMNVRLALIAKRCREELAIRKSAKKDYPLYERILDWAKRESAPNSRYSYHRCVVCHTTWWDTGEIHELGCWVPALRKKVSESAADVFGAQVHTTTGQKK